MKNNIHIPVPRNIAESLFPRSPFSEVGQLDGMQANLLEDVPPHLAEHVVYEIRNMGCTFFNLVKTEGSSDPVHRIVTHRINASLPLLIKAKRLMSEWPITLRIIVAG